jgi:hypothetical protein
MKIGSRAQMRRLAAPVLCALAVGVPTAVAGADPGPATAASSPAVAAAGAAAPGCDPNYAGGCVPVDAPAVACDQLAPATDLLVVGDDVYDLDRGGAGRVACEASGADTPVAVPAATAVPAVPEAAPPVPDAAVAGATAAAPSELARTGRTTVPLLAVSLTLLTLGGALMMAGRPRPDLVWHGALRRADVRFTVESVER